MAYIRIDRKILDWEWWSDLNTFRLFLYILLKANWKDGRFQGVDVPRGSLATSYQTLATETGLSISKVRTSLDNLKKTGELTVKRHAKFSVITVKNYCLYQSNDTVNDSQMTVKSQSNRSEIATIEEKKEDINNSNELFSAESQQEPSYRLIQDLYNSVCGSYPRLTRMSDRRKKAIRARLNSGYTADDFRALFEKAEKSEFLKGKNGRNWTASFDWLIQDANMAKVLDGNYDALVSNKTEQPDRKNAFHNFQQREYDYNSLEAQLLGGGIKDGGKTK